MRDGQPSRTAFLMALLRAHHYLHAESPRILDDHLAMGIVGLPDQAGIDAAVGRVTDMFAEYGDRHLACDRIHELTMLSCVRGRLVEDELAAAVARGVGQFVILGAGLDTIAYRSAVARELKVFELDYPATQAWKRAQLTAMGIAVPDNVTFVPCDFEHQTLSEALHAGGVEVNALALFSWLGVQAYLTDAAVMATLGAIGRFPSGSGLVLDFATKDVLSPAREKMVEGGRQKLIEMGEPFRSAYAPTEFAERLHKCGFSSVDIMTIPDWLRRHEARFAGRFAATAGLSRLAAARVL